MFLKKTQENFNNAKEILRQATEARIRIQNGEDFPVQPQPVEPTPQPVEPTPPVVPCEPEPAQPVEPQPQQPVTQDPNYIPVPGSADHPPLDIENGTQIPTQPDAPFPAQPQPQQPAQPQPQQPATPQEPNYIPVQGQPNHPPLNIQEGTAFPTQPDLPLPTQPSPVGLNPYDQDTQPIGGPTTPTQPVQNPQPVEDSQPTQLRFHIVKRGDTLTLIAKNELGDMRRWKEIHNLNKEVIGYTNTHWIYPGQKLRLPTN